VRPRISRLRRFLPLLGAALLVSGCGAGGLVTNGDKENGKKLFLGKGKCAGCHTLAAAGASGTVGPNLDDSFAQARAEGFKESAIADIVAGQIRVPGQYPTGSGLARLTSNMPANLLHGQDVDDVAAFVAANAGTQGFTEATAVTSLDGKTIFKAKCGGCHTLADAGTSGTTGPNLDQLKPPFARVQKQVTNGGPVMPAFKGLLRKAQIDAVAKYVSSHAGK
jgi:cbb3-type cytochrome c oxidase subunit III